MDTSFRSAQTLNSDTVPQRMVIPPHAVIPPRSLPDDKLMGDDDLETVSFCS